jgi:hypothetical protein
MREKNFVEKRTGVTSLVKRGLLLLFCLVFLGEIAQAANWYVRPSQHGSNTGIDWNNAWSIETLNGNWAKVKPGDTIWLAGGTYSATIKPMVNGTAENFISIKRPLSSDAAPTQAVGWQSAFDSQVVIAPGSGQSAIWHETLNVGSFFIFDGRQDSGIKLVKDNSSLGGAYPAAVAYRLHANSHDVFYRNIDIVGPFDSATPIGGINNYHAGITIFPTLSGSVVSNVTFTACRIHGTVNLVNILAVDNEKHSDTIIFEYCKFYNNLASSSDFHANMFEMKNTANLIVRYSEFYNWLVEGFMPYGPSFGPIYIYGNIFRDPYKNPDGGQPNVARVFEPFTSWQVFVYNNTFVNIAGMGVFSPAGRGSWAPGSMARNNIYWNSFINNLPPPQDFEFSNGAVAGANSISNGSNPFLNLAGKDFRLTETIGMSYPRNRGQALSSQYQRDPSGAVRGADGFWDMGAYEFSSSVANTNPVISLSSAALNFGGVPVGASKDIEINVSNVGAGTLSGSATANSPFSILSQQSYSLTAGQSVSIMIRYSPTTAGQHTAVVTFSGGGGATASLSGSGTAPASGLSFSATSGAISSPFVVYDSYISQASETTLANSGRASYTVSIPDAGKYVIAISINASSDAANSLFVAMDGEPTDPYMIWDIPVTIGFEQRFVGWRGLGTHDNSEFPRKDFDLTAGNHTLVIRGREANVEIGDIAFVKMPSPPGGLQISTTP